VRVSKWVRPKCGFHCECQRLQKNMNTTMYWEEKKKQRWFLSRLVMSDNCLQAGVWRLEGVWIGSKLGGCVPYFEYFYLLSWSECWLSGTSDLRVVLLVQTGAVSTHNSFGGWTDWAGHANSVLFNWFFVKLGIHVSAFLPCFVQVGSEVWQRHLITQGDRNWDISTLLVLVDNVFKCDVYL
jgi:hypothetical protein